MILVDTTVWIDHLRRPDASLLHLLGSNETLGHPYILGELVLGGVRDTGWILDYSDLAQAPIAEPGEVLRMIAAHTLRGTGIGYVDAHLLAATLLSPGATIWTRDHNLREVAERLSIKAELD